MYIMQPAFHLYSAAAAAESALLLQLLLLLTMSNNPQAVGGTDFFSVNFSAANQHDTCVHAHVFVNVNQTLTTTLFQMALLLRATKPH